MHKFRQKYIGDKAFYKRYLMLAIPMIIQNAITNLVSFLDNIMVGQLGTEQMSGVAIVNQLIFVYNLAVFGSPCYIVCLHRPHTAHIHQAGNASLS